MCERKVEGLREPPDTSRQDAYADAYERGKDAAEEEYELWLYVHAGVIRELKQDAECAMHSAFTQAVGFDADADLMKSFDENELYDLWKKSQDVLRQKKVEQILKEQS